MAKSDTLVILDSVKTNRKSWVTRSRIRHNGSQIWLRVPAQRKRDTLIEDIGVSPEFQSGRKVLATLKHSYESQESYDHHLQGLSPIFAEGYSRVSDLNLALIRYFRGELGLETKILIASELFEGEPWLYELRGNALLLRMAIEIEATSYISGLGCLDFISPREWEAHGIAFSFIKMPSSDFWQGTGKDQAAQIDPMLSVVDALMRIGSAKLSPLIGKSELVPPSQVLSALASIEESK